MGMGSGRSRGTSIYTMLPLPNLAGRLTYPEQERDMRQRPVTTM